MPIPLLPAIPAIGKGLGWLIGLGATYFAGKKIAEDPPRIRLGRTRYESLKPYNPPGPVAPVYSANAANAANAANKAILTRNALNEALKYYRDLSGGLPVVLTKLSPRPAMDSYVDLTDYVTNVLRYGHNSEVLPQITVTAPRPPLVLRSLTNSDDTLSRLTELERQIREMNALNYLNRNNSNNNNNNNNNNKTPRWIKNALWFGAGAVGKSIYDGYNNNALSDSLSIKTNDAASGFNNSSVWMPDNPTSNTVSSDTVSPVNKVTPSTNNSTNDSTINWDKFFYNSK